MIGKMNRGLTIEVAFVSAFIGLAFRSALVMLVSILPAIFPIVLSGTLLWMMGEGLQFASVVALTVSFGLGLSADHSFLEPAAARGAAGRGSGKSRGAGDCACRPALDFYVRGACVRSDRDGLLRSTVAAPVRLAVRVCHASRADYLAVPLHRHHVPVRNWAAELVVGRPRRGPPRQ